MSKFMRKSQIWASQPYFGDVRGDARPWLMARWKAHGRLSIRVNWTFFAIYLRGKLWVMRQNVYSSAVFARGSTSLHSNFTWTGSFPSTVLGIRKLETLRYPTVRPHPSAFPRFDTMLECDGRIRTIKAISLRFFAMQRIHSRSFCHKVFG